MLLMGHLPRHSDERIGLHWEFSRLLRDDLRERLVLVVPPISDRDLAERWAAYRALSNNQLPDFQGGEIVAVPNGPSEFSIGRVCRPVRMRECWMYAKCLHVNDADVAENRGED